MKTYPNCKTSFGNDAGFCPSCGTKLIESQENQSIIHYCKGCGNAMSENSAFCPVCGTRTNANSALNSTFENQSYQNPVDSGYAPNVNHSVYQPPVYKQPNPKIESFKNNLKLVFSNPEQAIDNEFADNNIFTALISSGILLASFVIMFMCIAGKADSEFHIDELYGLGIIGAILCTVFFMLIPSATAFVSSKLNNDPKNFVGVLSANGLKTVYISAFLIITAFSALISFKMFALMLLLTGMMNTFLSVSYINRASTNTLNSAKSLWSTYGIYAVLKIIATAIVYLVMSSVLEDLIQDIISDFLWSSMF